MRDFFLSPVFIWLALMIIFIVVEIATVGLTSIWFAGGALAALAAALIGMSVPVQAVCFFMAAIALVLFTRPFALKFVKPHNIRTNYEDIIGREVQVTARVDNRADTGTAVFNGQEWTARSAEDGMVMEAGETAHVKEIKGVKLYLTKIKTEK